MKQWQWILLGVAVLGGGALWYSRNGSSSKPQPVQPKADPRALALSVANDLIRKWTS